MGTKSYGTVRDEDEVAELYAWRLANGLVTPRQTWMGAPHGPAAAPPFHYFFCFDPAKGADLSKIGVDGAGDNDVAVFSIPDSFADDPKRRFVPNDDRAKVLDIQAWMDPRPSHKGAAEATRPAAKRDRPVRRPAWPQLKSITGAASTLVK